MLNRFARASKTIITATHDLHILEDTAETVYVFGQDRKPADHGTPTKILGNTALLQANNLIHVYTRHTRDHRIMKTFSLPVSGLRKHR